MQQNMNYDGNVVELRDFMSDSRFAAISEVDAYWEALKRGRDMPSRSDIDPRGIENTLEYAFILERIAPGLARLRIAGMHLRDLMGMEVRGMPISSFIETDERESFSKMLEAVVADPAKARISLEAETGIGAPKLEGRMLLLPLRDDMGEVTRYFGCLSTLGQVGNTPRRFRITRTELTPIRGKGAPVMTGAQKLTSVPGMAEAPSPFTPAPAKSRPAPGARPSYLKLVKSDDQ